MNTEEKLDSSTGQSDGQVAAFDRMSVSLSLSLSLSLALSLSLMFSISLEDQCCVVNEKRNEKMELVGKKLQHVNKEVAGREREREWGGGVGRECLMRFLSRSLSLSLSLSVSHAIAC